MIPHYYEEIQGGFDFQDLYREAVTQAPDGATLVELGCWRGQSLSFLLVEAANSGKRLNIVGVDPFLGRVGDDDHARELSQRGNVEAECRRNCDRAGYPYRLHVLTSLDAANQFLDETIDFVFIDGSHDFASVCNDIRAWLPKIRWGGTLAGHDYLGAWPGVKHAVRDYLSPSELSFRGVSWAYRKILPQRGSWLRRPAEGADWLLYLPFVNRPDLLRQALHSVRGSADRVVVIDQSQTGEALEAHPGPVFRWNSQLHFSAVMNWIQRDASHRKLRWFLFMHSDAEVASGGLRTLCDEADRLDCRREQWGVIFTHYDALALFNPKATAQIGCWDETFKWYVADIDYYNRLRWQGWGHRHLPTACAIHHGSQTIRSMNEVEREAVAQDHGWAIRHYRHKWGCDWKENAQGRIWSIPYNGEKIG